MADEKMSLSHRIAQEMVSGALFNCLSSQTDENIRLDLERRIGGDENFLISDIRISHPRRIAAEIIYRSSHIALKRRLRLLYQHDYDLLLVCISNGRFSPAQIQKHLQKVSSIKIGVFDPQSFELTLGSLISPRQIDPETVNWDRLPEYLS